MSGAAVPFSMAGNSNDSSYEVGVEVSQQHGSRILDCHLDNDRTFLCMQQSSKILYHIYEEWFGDSKSVFTTKLCEAGTEDVLRYVRDMIFAMVRRKLRWHNDSCLIERRNCSTLKKKLPEDIHDIFSLGEGGISSLPKSLFKPENQSHRDQSCQIKPTQFMVTHPLKTWRM